ncbi:hypothetical protein K439DRAFT_1615744 [Ramaria rubella]|nr:hypothetical protein K439DRAFT_1615744 [Ramaria rubella]
MRAIGIGMYVSDVRAHRFGGVDRQRVSQTADTRQLKKLCGVDGNERGRTRTPTEVLARDLFLTPRWAVARPTIPQPISGWLPPAASVPFVVTRTPLASTLKTAVPSPPLSTAFFSPKSRPSPTPTHDHNAHRTRSFLFPSTMMDFTPPPSPRRHHNSSNTSKPKAKPKTRRPATPCDRPPSPTLPSTPPELIFGMSPPSTHFSPHFPGQASLFARARQQSLSAAKSSYVYRACSPTAHSHPHPHSLTHAHSHPHTRSMASTRCTPPLLYSFPSAAEISRAKAARAEHSAGSGSQRIYPLAASSSSSADEQDDDDAYPHSHSRSRHLDPQDQHQLHISVPVPVPFALPIPSHSRTGTRSTLHTDIDPDERGDAAPRTGTRGPLKIVGFDTGTGTGADSDSGGSGRGLRGWDCYRKGKSAFGEVELDSVVGVGVHAGRARKGRW